MGVVFLFYILIEHIIRNMKEHLKKVTVILGIIMMVIPMTKGQITYPIVDTDVSEFYNNNSVISSPSTGQAFYGQDANYNGNSPSYTDNGDQTISDNVTGLMWQKDMGIKISYADAFNKADTMTLGGFTDWRVPTIKELYSLIVFTGRVSGEVPYEMFIDSGYFNQELGDTSIGERLIDAQTWSATQYKSTTMNGDSTVFGVNFLDGRIKGYPKYAPGSNNNNPKTMYFRMVRGNTDYGINNFVDNGDGTITDNATGLMWQQADDGQTRDWQDALSYAENLTLAGNSDWRLPNAKELQSIVDYTRCPDVSNSPAINPLFSTTEISDPDGNAGQYGYFWTGTSHLDGVNPYTAAVYIAFGEAQGKMNNNLMDVHGAGAQRSDPKTGNIADYPQFFGPQGDVRYVFNFVRCVRDISTLNSIDNSNIDFDIQIYPNPTHDFCIVHLNRAYSSVNVTLINLLGETMTNVNMQNTNELIINTKDLDQGCYIIQIKADGKQMTKKLLKN